MKKVILIGAGGHAAELRDYIRFNNNMPNRKKIEVEGFIDDDPSTYEHYAYEEAFLGAIKGHEVRQDVCYLMAIANLKYRRLIIERFIEEGAELIGFIHPTALISPSAEIHPSAVISHIGHDTQIGDYNFISPQVALSGNTKIGNENLLGTNSATIPGVKIGNNNLIGAGAIVIKDLPDGVTVVGNKARILERK
jgi:acetyltransferase EpsM